MLKAMVGNNLTFRRLDPQDVAEYRRLRLFGLRESPSAFGSAHEEESRRPRKFFAARLEQAVDKCTLGAFAGRRLVGVVTLVRETSLKEKHKASIHGMYVAPGLRKRGIGRELLIRAIEVARRLRGVEQVRLAVTASNLPALRLYESAGFAPYGEEPRALCVRGRYHAETLLSLNLR